LKLNIFVLFISLLSVYSYAQEIYSQGICLIETEEYPISLYQDKMLDKTKDALLSFDYIEDRADYLVFKLKNLTFGDYSDNVMYVTPLVTGSVVMSAYNFNVYYNHFQKKSGVQFKVKF